MIDDKLIYSMKGKTQNFSLKKFMVRVALVTLILAAIEVPIIYFYAAKKSKPEDAANSVNQNTAVIKDTPKPAENNIAAIAEEPKKDTIEAPKEIVQEELPKTIITTDTIPAKQAVVEVKKPPVKIIEQKKIDTAKLKLVKVEPKPVKTEATPELKVEKELTGEKMMEIMNDLNAERIKLNKTSRCVKIRKTATSNVSNAFKIVDYLKAKGFIISGREESSKKQHGITIDGSGDCFVVTIGSM
jgi:hypothetical protein